MTSAYEPPSRNWSEVVGHVLLRLLLIVVGYFVSVLVTLVAVVVIYSFLSNFAGAPDRFAAMSVTPIVAMIVPWIGGLIYLVACVLSCVFAAPLALVAEAMKLRSVFIHMIFGAVVSAATFYMLVPSMLDGTSTVVDWRDTLVMAAAGLFGGVSYWLIAGRNAGFVPDPLPLPSILQMTSPLTVDAARPREKSR